MKILVVVGTLLNINLFAQQNMHERKPPEEAITTCEGKSNGESCSMTTPRGDTVEGICSNTPDNKYFACNPNNMRSPRR